MLRGRGRVRDSRHPMLPELHLSDWRADQGHAAPLLRRSSARSGWQPRRRGTTGGMSRSTSTCTGSRPAACTIATRRSRSRSTSSTTRWWWPPRTVGRGSFALRDGLSVAEFDRQLHATLAELGIDIEIKEEPFGVPMTTPFAADLKHASWDRDAVERFGTDPRLERRRARRVRAAGLPARPVQVHVFWHSLDLAVTRVLRPPGRDPRGATGSRARPTRSEVISFGFWAGDDNLGDAAYYSYTAPEPDGLRDQPLAGGEWIDFGSGSLALLPYETVRSSPEPRTTLLAFCQSAYEAGARLAGWDTSAFTSAWCPTPAQLTAPPRHRSGSARSNGDGDCLSPINSFRTLTPAREPHPAKRAPCVPRRWSARSATRRRRSPPAAADRRPAQ